jgi:hypothetical protein
MNKYLYIFIPFFVIVVIVWIYFHLQLQHDRRKYEQVISEISFLNHNLNEDQKILLENECCILDTSLCFVNLKNQTIPINSLPLTGRYLVLFFSSDHCSDCVNYGLSQIKTLILDNGIDKVLLFASRYQLRDLYVFAHSNKFSDSMVYNIESLKIPIEQINQPFMFLLDDELTVSHFFIPRKEIPEHTNYYLGIVKFIMNEKN